MPLRYLILDATAIIHFFANNKTLVENEILIIPETIRGEIKSKNALMVLDLMEDENKILYELPSSDSSKKIISITKQTGDFKSLSEQDLSVLAIALDYPGCTVISDDYAVQNVCSHLGISFDSYAFRIKKQRKYFWKCNSCGSKFDVFTEKCIDCGDKLKRYYKTTNTKN